MRNNFTIMAKRAHRILNSQKRSYSVQKSLIASFFNNKSCYAKDEIIKLRLVMIDYFYSTQMNRRYYGIEEIIRNINACYRDIKTIKQLDKQMKDDFISFIGKEIIALTILITLYTNYLMQVMVSTKKARKRVRRFH